VYTAWTGLNSRRRLRLRRIGASGFISNKLAFSRRCIQFPRADYTRSEWFFTWPLDVNRAARKEQIFKIFIQNIVFKPRFKKHSIVYLVHRSSTKLRSNSEFVSMVHN